MLTNRLNVLNEKERKTHFSKLDLCLIFNTVCIQDVNDDDDLRMSVCLCVKNKAFYNENRRSPGVGICFHLRSRLSKSVNSNAHRYTMFADDVILVEEITNVSESKTEH